MRLSLTLLLVPLLFQLRPSAPEGGKGPVDWLTGCWENRQGDRLIEERWMPAKGSVMLEVGRTTRGDSLLEYEFVVLHLAGGSLSYEAHPSGQPTETFPLKTLTDSSFVVEALAHDFPQRVGYNRRGADSLLGWIEGNAGGAVKRIEFPYARVKCE
ncbi:MAG: DUF6265 family protein [Gemmatimonadota bacterium]